VIAGISPLRGLCAEYNAWKDMGFLGFTKTTAGRAFRAGFTCIKLSGL
jgi:hypothetical protein